MSSPLIKIGTITLKHQKEIDDRSFECAAWSLKGLYKRQVVDLRADFNHEGHLRGLWFILQGTVIADCFVSLFGGVAIGPYDEHQNAGKPCTYSGHGDLFDLLASQDYEVCLGAETLVDFRLLKGENSWGGVRSAHHHAMTQLAHPGNRESMKLFAKLDAEKTAPGLRVYHQTWEEEMAAEKAGGSCA